MERATLLEDLKDGKLSPEFLKLWPKEATFIWSCLSASAEHRPSAFQILESEIFEQDPEESIETLIKENRALKELLRMEKEQSDLARKRLLCKLKEKVGKIATESLLSDLELPQ